MDPHHIQVAPASPAHLTAASAILRLIAVLGGLLSVVLLIGGVYLAFADRVADTTFRLFGNDFSSTSVGVSMAFIGAVLAAVVFRRLLKSIDHLAALPDKQ
jgi:hypothetical protein